MNEILENLFVNGAILPSDKNSVAIVGSRSMSSYGKSVAYKFSYFLASKGITIVSGLARGVDSIAHKAALDAGGRTIAVLGSGLDVIYPPENKSLVQKIIKSGAVVSQFPSKTPPLGKNFLKRNRVIAALSAAVIVVEGKRRSGTLSTVTHALELGKEIFAVPGPVTSELSYLPNYLIENGARIARDPNDILEYLKELTVTLKGHGHESS